MSSIVEFVIRESTLNLNTYSNVTGRSSVHDAHDYSLSYSILGLTSEGNVSGRTDAKSNILINDQSEKAERRRFEAGVQRLLHRETLYVLTPTEQYRLLIKSISASTKVLMSAGISIDIYRFFFPLTNILHLRSCIPNCIYLNSKVGLTQRTLGILVTVKHG